MSSPPAGFSQIDDPLAPAAGETSAPAGYQPIENPLGQPVRPPVPGPGLLERAAGDYVGIGDATLGLIGQYAERPLVEGIAGIAGRLAAPFKGEDSNAASAAAKAAVDPYVYTPQTPAGREIVGAVNKGAQWMFGPTARWLSNANQSVEHTLGPTWGNTLDEAEGTAQDLSQAAPVFGTAAGVARDIADSASGMTELAPRATYTGKAAETAARSTYGPTAEENLAAQLAKGNMGAAAAVPSLAGTSAGLQDAVANAKNINPDALTRQTEAETLPQPEGVGPLRLRKGQATADPQQFSDEINLRADPDTEGILERSITDQNDKLGSAMGEIRRRATPAIVQRTNIEHGQTAIDAIKDQDNAAVNDIRAKYKALTDQNGGSMPIDTGAASEAIKGALSEGLLTKTAEQNPVISEVMDGLNSGKPMSFESFENARTNLAGVQRGADPNAARAAAIVRNGLENMPLSSDATELKTLADTARQAAKARFDTIEQNPAYDAAINDNVRKDQNGLHVIGAPSPLADTFMDRYFLGNGQSASRAYVARMQNLMQSNPDFSQAVEAATLNKLRNSAGLDEYDNGKFRTDSYRSAFNALSPKIDVLTTPQTAQWADQLKRVAGYVNDEPKGASVNRPNTALTLQRFGAIYLSPPTVKGALADIGTDIAAAHTGPVGYVGKRVGSVLWKNAQVAKAAAATKAAKLSFAKDATATGAGIDSTPIPAARAAGGAIARRQAGTDDPALAAKPSSDSSRAGIGFSRDSISTPDSTPRGSARPGISPMHRTGSGTRRTFPDGTPARPDSATRRATGGKVDHEVLVSRLMSRWHSARKAESKRTEPLLNLPDSTVERALEITGRLSA